jgi:hypothetical protein
VVLFTPRVARDRPSQMDDSQCFGPDVAQVGDEIRGPGLRCVLRFPRGLERAVFGSLGRLWFKIFFKNFSFSETVISLVN